MKPENLIRRLDEFFTDKHTLNLYLQEVAAGLVPQPKEVQQHLKIADRWKRYPSLNRSLLDIVERLEQLSPGSVQRQDFLVGSGGYSTRDTSSPAGSLAAVPHPSGDYSSSSNPSPGLSSVNSPVLSPVSPEEPISAGSSPTIIPTMPSSLTTPLGTRRHLPPRIHLSTPQARAERQSIRSQEECYERALEDLLEHRLSQTMEFGRSCTASSLAAYTSGLFGELLGADMLLSFAQQLSLADVPIINAKGQQISSTGFHIAFCGDPGTGKTFAIKDFILGNPKLGVPAHGLPGRNRYCGSITAAKFVRIGEAYQDQQFNFIIPEFDDWFSSKPLVNTLKAAMEGGPVEYETHREKIGPYVFPSFFTVNYNIQLPAPAEGGYSLLEKNPHFHALEDRMLTLIQRMTPERYAAVSEAKEKLEKGELPWEQAGKFRDLLLLVYAIETQHQYVAPLAKQFGEKSLLVGEHFYQVQRTMREVLLAVEEDTGAMPFSPRLEKRVLQLAGALSLSEYFRVEEIKSGSDSVPAGEALVVGSPVPASDAVKAGYLLPAGVLQITPPAVHLAFSYLLKEAVQHKTPDVQKYVLGIVGEGELPQKDNPKE